MPRYGTIDRDYGMRLANCDPATDGPIYMLNLMKYRDAADYGGKGGDASVSGREADDRYAPVDVLAAIGAKVCFTAEVLDASDDWDRVAVVRYPTRRAFIEMQSRKDFQEKHVHKEAGMHHTIVMATLPVGDLPARYRRSACHLASQLRNPHVGLAPVRYQGRFAQSLVGRFGNFR